MIKAFLEKLLESLKSVLPVTVVIIIVGLFLNFSLETYLMFLLGAALLVLGLALFQLGAFESTSVIAEDIGKYVVKRRNLVIFIAVSFMLGFFIIVAEPSVRVLASQLKDAINPELIMILTVAVGVGLLMTVGLLRILFKISFRTIMLILYGIVFVLAIILSQVNPFFVSVAFDSGGFATGPLSVPFIMSLAYGISRARGDKSSNQDSFGLVGITVVGPILAVLVLGLIYKVDPATIVKDETVLTLGDYLLQYTKDMAIAILPFIVFFVLFQFIDFKYPKKKVIKVLIAFVYTYIGLVLFLAGANASFASVAYLIGGKIASLDISILLIFIGSVFGLLVAAPEPSVVAVNKQVEEVTAGAVSKNVMLVAISIGVAIALILSMIKVLTGISILYFVIPGYTIALALMFITPKLFSSIAFDAGSATSGALTTAFLMPFAIGAAEALYPTHYEALLHSYGLVVLVSMAPVLSIQILGMIHAIRQRRVEVIEGIDDIMDF
ncbi:MAG: DUF1538 domain-containing protein [Acholeplasmataceae bacterium]|jgi:hypothetical protein|nr:DUF1538 domain-containing protein [Acholeplasmataceae bacterium]